MHYSEQNMQHAYNTIFLSLESMILLGSIERCELQAAYDWWLSAERRITNQGQAMRSPGSMVSWESFHLVDEEGGEESKEKVNLGFLMDPNSIVYIPTKEQFNFNGLGSFHYFYHFDPIYTILKADPVIVCQVFLDNSYRCTADLYL